MRKTIWDIPNYHGCNKWSHDGMLAVLTANSIQVFTPTFRHNSFYLARWIHLEMLGENDGVPKKSKVYVAPKESFTASTADDLIKWMSTVNSTDDRSFGKLDINSLNFKKALWSPPGLGIFSSSYLSTLLSDGSLLLIVMGGSSRANHRLFTNDRRFNVHMFSSSIALDISSLFQEWLLHNGNGAGLTGQTTKIDSDSDSADDSRGKSRKERFEPPSSPSNTCMINEIACYPNLLSYNGIQRGRISCMILATGSSSGHINLWGVRSASGSLLEASCVSSVLLTESSLNTASSSSSEFLREHSYSQSISCIEFLTTANDFSNSSHGNFSTRLLCGTSEGFLVIFDISSVHKNIQNGEINSGNFDLRYVEDDFPILSMGQPTHILRPFDSPIDSIIISRKERYSLYLRSGVKLVQTDNNFRHIFPVENIHSHIVTSISVLDNREYSMIGNDILLTSSLDGDLKLWMEPSDRSYPYVPYHNTNINKENNHNTQIDGTSIIELDKNMKQSRDENCNLNFVQLFNVNDTLNNNNLSYVDITCDPLQLIFSITHLIPSSIIDSREVQMNKNLERSHCGVYFFLSPILDLKWITIPENVLQVIRSVIFNAPKTPHSNTSDCIINSRNCDDGGIGRSNCTNSSGNEHGHDERKEEKEDFKSYYHNYCEEYSEVKGYSGVSFCWVKSVDEVVQHYVDSHMNTAEGSLTINERTELGIVDTNKRYQEKGKTDDDDENEEVDGVAGKTGISDVAHKVKNLLYPDIEKLLDDSFEVATSAAYTISVDLNALVGQDNEHTNGSKSNINTSINIDTSYDNFQEEILSKRFDSNLDCVYLYEDGDSFLSAVLLLPINGKI